MVFFKKNDNFDKIINSLNIQAGSIIKLYGDLGAGKTTFARYFIRKLQKNEALDIISPSFSILEVYDHDTHPIWHFDLYRLNTENDIWDFDIERGLQNTIILIEWPQIIDAVHFDNVKSLLFSENNGVHSIEVL